MDSRRSFVEILKQSPAREEEAIDKKDCASSGNWNSVW